MKLYELTIQYVAYKQSMGMRFRTEARVLKSFFRNIGDGDVDQLEPDVVDAFLAGNGPITRFWHRKYQVLCGFYRFAIARRHVELSPLPRMVPKPPPPFVPYIYSQDELQRLLIAAESRQHSRAKMQSHTCRALLLLLYGAGLRISEALSLTLADVDLPSGILTIRESKFYKTRLVPIGSDLIRAMTSYQSRRLREHPAKRSAPFFVSRLGEPVTRQAAERAFRRMCLHAGVSRHDGSRYQPRLHDLRHAAAVHRLVSWYRAGADVQRLLPQLATYLGHIHSASTQRYLTMTPELLNEASRRFARYAMEETHE
jgi:site-specific recombinase XerD